MSRGRGPDRGSLIKFAVFAVLTSLLTFGIGAQIVGTTFDARYELKATFDDVGGLAEGDLVKVAGAPVGRVTGVKVVDGRALVHLRVDDGVKLPADSSAEVRWRSLIGQRMVYLMPGKTTGKWLEDGATITSTKAVVDLGEIVNALGPLTRNLDPAQLNKILEATARMLDGNDQNLDLLQVNLQKVVQTFADRKDQLASITDSFATLTEVSATRDKQIGRIIDDLVAISEAFVGNTELLGDASGELAQVSGVLDQVISGNQRQLDSAVDNLEKLFGTAVLNMEGLEKIVTDLPPGLRSLFSVSNGGQYTRINVMCLGIVPGECPFPMVLPGTGHATPFGTQKKQHDQLGDLIKQLSRKGGR